MEEPLIAAIRKLAFAGEQAGFTVEQTIELLNAGLTVETLLHLIERRLAPPKVAPCTSRWVV